ncbi:MAG TPA: glycogen synthase GlgA [Casimicrobiaceae bacterium]|nr:glycogen synthase GlgA [Casimicrobiaceae bacterium]
MIDAQLRVLFATAECAPLVKTGGLGDVSAALPIALRKRGVDVRVLLPGYRPVLDALRSLAHARVRPCTMLAHAGQSRLIEVQLPNGIPLIAIDHPSLYDRPGSPYQDEGRADWPDNPLRFGLLSKAAAMLAGDASPLGWKPDVVHCNDWHAAMCAAYLRSRGSAGSRRPSMLTVHNLAHQGLCGSDWLGRIGLSGEGFTPDGFEFHGRVSFLKAGLQFADAITTVSPTYAREIQTDEGGVGLGGVLRARQAALAGILNGIDVEEWDPARDPLIARRYDRDSLDSKGANAAALRAEFRLENRPAVPLFAVVSRLVGQKGIDLVADIATRLVALPVQLLILGEGESDLERRLVGLATSHPRQIAVRIGFDAALAHRIEAGADAFLMPSRFEPCGMNQMYSQRYGTLPIVRRTGGLADTVVDCTPSSLAEGRATGFAFDEPSAEALYAACERAARVFRHDPAAWRKLQVAAMARDFSWDASASRYQQLYGALTQRTVTAAAGAH